MTTFYQPAKLCAGTAALDNLQGELASLGSYRPLILVSPGPRRGSIEKLLRRSQSYPEIALVPCDGTMEMSTLEALFRDNGSDAVVVVGEKAAIDTAGRLHSRLSSDQTCTGRSIPFAVIPSGDYAGLGMNLVIMDPRLYKGKRLKRKAVAETATLHQEPSSLHQMIWLRAAEAVGKETTTAKKRGAFYQALSTIIAELAGAKTAESPEAPSPSTVAPAPATAPPAPSTTAAAAAVAWNSAAAVTVPAAEGRIPPYFEFSSRGRVISGGDALSSLSRALSDLGGSRVLLLSDAGVEAAGLTAKVKKALSAGDSVKVAASDSAIPSDSALPVVVRLAELYREKGCDAIVALGGGSVLDTAKGVNILAGTNSRNLVQWAGAGKIDRPLLPLAAIPTTSGTGSEATLVAVIADHDAGRKLLYTSTFLQPDIAILDPEMTASLPPFLTAATGMDALTHAVEAYYCRGHNPLSDAHALEAVRLVGAYLTVVVADPENREGRAALSEASNLAGLAFSNSMVGMVHTLGHSIGAVCGIHHGLCMALLLPWGIQYNLPGIERETAPLLKSLTGKTAQGDEGSGAALVEEIHRLNRELHRLTGGRHPRCLSEIRGRDGEPLIRREHLPKIAEVAMGDGSILYNPEELEYRDALILLEEAFQAGPEGEVSFSSS